MLHEWCSCEWAREKKGPLQFFHRKRTKYCMRIFTSLKFFQRQTSHPSFRNLRPFFEDEEFSPCFCSVGHSIRCVLTHSFILLSLEESSKCVSVCLCHCRVCDWIEDELSSSLPCSSPQCLKQSSGQFVSGSFSLSFIRFRREVGSLSHNWWEGKS